MRQCDVAWVAGLFEGEGSIGIDSNAGAGLGSTDEDVVRRVHQLTGVGHVHERAQLQSGKRFWFWKVTRADDVITFLRAIHPYLGERRRERADLAILVAEEVLARKAGPFSCPQCEFQAGSPGGLGRHQSAKHAQLTEVVSA